MTIFSPHPDDLELSAGLLTHRAIGLGWRVVEIIATDGSLGGVDPTVFGTTRHRVKRKKEAMRGAKKLGIESLKFLDFPDGGLINFQSSLTMKIKEIINELNPRLVCFPSRFDTHFDHLTTHLAVSEAIGNNIGIHQLQYCFWGKDNRKNVCIKNEKGIESKLTAIREHRSQPIDKYFERFSCADSSSDTLLFENFYSPQQISTLQFLKKEGFFM
jgi:LmbE family N-acetylglucosaminyl deacetylase